MAAGLIIFPGAFPSRSRTGARISAQIAFYENGTVTPKTVYADVGLTTPLSNPVLSNALGAFPTIYADTADEFTAVWSTADGQSRTLDDLTPSASANQTILDQTEAIRDQTEGLKDDTQQIKDDTLGVYDDAVALYGSLADVAAAVAASQAAQGLSEDARDASQGFRDASQGFRDEAEGFSTDAGNSATAAANSEAQANLYAVKASAGSYLFEFVSGTSDVNPGTGGIAFNNADPELVTFIYVNDTSSFGSPARDWVLDFGSSTDPDDKGRLYVSTGADGSRGVYRVTDSVTGATGYCKIPVQWVSGDFAASASDPVGMSFNPKGDVGIATGTITTVSTTVTDNTTLSTIYLLVPVQMSAAGKAITLANATGKTLGGPSYIIDNSLGSYSVIIKNNDGTEISRIAPGGVASVSLVDNSTAAGVWAINGAPTSKIAVGYVAKTANYTVVGADWGKIIDCTSGTFTLSFTAAATLGGGFYCYLKNSGTGVITGPTVDGATLTLYPYDQVLIECDGSSFHALTLKRGMRPATSQITISGSPSTITISGWQEDFDDLELKLEDVVASNAANFRISVSTDGSSYSPAFTALASSSTFNGVIRVYDLRGVLGEITSSLSTTALSGSPATIALSTTSVYRRTPGVVSYIRLSMSAGSFSSGTITPRGR